MADESSKSRGKKPKQKRSPFKRLFSFARGEETDEDGIPAKNWIDATEDLNVSLDDMMAGSSADMPDHLHLISLKALREALGEFEWQRRDERIRMLSEGLIGRRLPKGATFKRFGEDAFVLVFPNTPDEQAGALTLMIADDMGYRLIGEQFGASNNCRIGIAKADTQLMVSGGGLDKGAMEIALNSVIPVETDFSKDRPDLDDDDDDFALPRNDVIDDTEEEGPSMNLGDLGGPGEASKVEPKWGELKKQKGPSNEARMIPGEKKKPDPGPEWVAADVEEKTENESDWFAMGAAASISPLTVGLPEDLFAVVHPAWSLMSGKIDLHVLAMAVQRGGATVVGSLVLGKEPSLQAIAVADRLLVEAGAKMLGGARKAPGAIIIPINWETMNEARFLMLNAAFGCIDDTIRKSRLMMELTHIPEGVSQERVKAVIQRLKTVSCGVLVRESLGLRRHALFRNAGAMAVGIDLEDERMYHDALPMALQDEFMEHENVSGYMWGLRRKADLLAAVEADYQFVAGAALKKPGRDPIKAISMPREKMLVALEKFKKERVTGGGDDLRSTPELI